VQHPSAADGRRELQRDRVDGQSRGRPHVPEPAHVVHDHATGHHPGRRLHRRRPDLHHPHPLRELMNKEVDMPTPWSSVWSSRAFNIALGVVLALAMVGSAFLPLALTHHQRVDPATTGTFKTQYLVVSTNGQDALFSTNGGANQNDWIGGGGQSVGGAGVPGTGAD